MHAEDLRLTEPQGSRADIHRADSGVQEQGVDALPGETTRILVADANATVRKILGHVFARLGWEMLEAKDGEMAIQRARQRPAPHAILLDLNLPVIDGYEVCRRLKGDIEFQVIPIVALIALEQADEKMRALDAGVDEFLSKPVNHAELQVRLRSLMRTHRFNQELIGAEDVAMALARAVASKDGYSNSHVEQVANLAEEFSRSLGVTDTEQKVIRYGAILHNVGKIAIPDAVLEKTTSLSPREKALFQHHPRVGYDICSPLKPLKPVLPIIRHHKEHWDGTGFPDGLRGNDIPLGAQIVGIVDVYSALTSDRPFRKAIGKADACAELRKRAEMGCHSRDLVDAFIGCLGEIGEQVQQQASHNNSAHDDQVESQTRSVANIGAEGEPSVGRLSEFPVTNEP